MSQEVSVTPEIQMQWVPSPSQLFLALGRMRNELQITMFKRGEWGGVSEGRIPSLEMTTQKVVINKRQEVVINKRLNLDSAMSPVLVWEGTVEMCCHLEWARWQWTRTGSEAPGHHFSSSVLCLGASL